MSRNIVLVTVDSLRADHCGYISNCSLTPTLDAMAAEGVAFHSAQSPGPRTPSAMPTIFTGSMAQPTNAGIQQWQQRRQQIREHLGRYRTVAERLADRGYTTVGLTVNPWTEETGFEAGFDQFTFVEAGLDNIDDASRTAGYSLVETLMDRTSLGDRVGWQNMRDWFVRWTDFYPAIESVLSEAPGPFFVWVFLLDPHQPYIAPSGYRTELSAAEMYYTAYEEWRRTDDQLDEAAARRLTSAYADTVRSVDGFLERLQADLPTETTVVVHADHGEAFGEHGTYGHEPELYQENLHVPLVVSNVPSARVDEPVSVGSIPEMLCAIADDPAGFTPATYTTDHVVSRTEMADKWAVYDGRWKYILDVDAGTEVLYDTADDPNETQNLHAAKPELTENYRRRLDIHRCHQLEKARIAAGVKAVSNA